MPRSADKAPDTRLDAVQIAYPFSVQHAGSVQVSRLISLLLSAVVNAGGLLPVSHAVLCSLDMSDRHNTEIRAVSVDKGPSPILGAAERCVRDDVMLQQSAALNCQKLTQASANKRHRAQNHHTASSDQMMLYFFAHLKVPNPTETPAAFHPVERTFK